MSTLNEENEVVSQDACGHKKEPCTNTFDGKVVSITGNKLVMVNKEGKHCSHTLATDAKLTRDGANCHAADLKVGSKIRVTTKKEDRGVAIGIESLDKHAEFGKCCS
jgi:hypothetical protein